MERVAGRTSLSCIWRRRDYHAFVTARMTMNSPKSRENARAVGSASARKPRLDITTRRRLKEGESRR
jgi:hypothetical protein